MRCTIASPGAALRLLNGDPTKPAGGTRASDAAQSSAQGDVRVLRTVLERDRSYPFHKGKEAPKNHGQQYVG
jgi:hypothetical protein